MAAKCEMLMNYSKNIIGIYKKSDLTARHDILKK